MLIFYGWKKFKKEYAGVTKNACSSCGNEIEWKMVKLTSWFTLFFIPIIPYKREYYFACPICNQGYKVANADAKKWLAETKIKLAENV